MEAEEVVQVGGKAGSGRLIDQLRVSWTSTRTSTVRCLTLRFRESLVNAHRVRLVRPTVPWTIQYAGGAAEEWVAGQQFSMQQSEVIV